MYTLITGHDEVPHNTTEWVTTRETTPNVRFEAFGVDGLVRCADVYSFRLLALVIECLAWHPDSRPDARTLLAEIESARKHEEPHDLTVDSPDDPIFRRLQRDPGNAPTTGGYAPIPVQAERNIPGLLWDLNWQGVSPDPSDYRMANPIRKAAALSILLLTDDNLSSS